MRAFIEWYQIVDAAIVHHTDSPLGSVLVANETGTGKTITYIGAIHAAQLGLEAQDAATTIGQTFEERERLSGEGYTIKVDYGSARSIVDASETRLKAATLSPAEWLVEDRELAG
ncbi:hypothetical protein SEUCBS140593_003337 [Sporothrix eucalyptigena]|uniref:Helicase ATP-binding domain-containing protein n=1 Tax=Sporothrix eucalyptigena TaxID=1812306 RepID=A0ABP0BEA9_9PEZI